MPRQEIVEEAGEEGLQMSRDTNILRVYLNPE